MNFLIDTYSYPLLGAAGDILNNAAASAQTATDASDAMWVALYKGSPIFGEIVKFCGAIAFLFLIIRGYRIYVEYRTNRDIAGIFISLLMPGIIVILLSQSGAPAKHLTYGLRTLTVNFGVNIIANVGSDLGASAIQKGIPQGTAAQQLLNEFSVKLDRCRLEPRSADGTSSPEICAGVELANLKRHITEAGITDPTITSYLNQVSTQVQAKLDAAAGKGNGTDGWSDVFKNIPNLTNLGEQIVTSILNGVTIMFYWAIELAGLLFFYLLPVALSMGMLDSKAVIDWFTCYWALVNAKICFAITLSLIGQISASVTGVSFVLELLMAFFAPFITFIFCKGSALSMAEGLSAIATATTVSGSRAAARSTISATKGTMNLGRKAIGKLRSKFA